MAHGHNDTGVAWEWDSVLLLSQPSLSSLEADGNNTSGLWKPLDSSDYGYHQHDERHTHETSSNRTHRDSHPSDAQQKESSNGDGGRDPRLDCPNFLAGRVPCACTDNDDDDSGVSRKRSKPVPRCQVAACSVELTDLKGYHQRHRVCLRCAHATRVILRGQPHRYCQQCGKFHPICDFDEGKRSCRRKLERHNNRRRRKGGEDGILGADSGDTDVPNETSTGDGSNYPSKSDVASERDPKAVIREKLAFDSEHTLQTAGISSGDKSSARVEAIDTSTVTDSGTLLKPFLVKTLEESMPASELLGDYKEVSESLELQFGQEQTCSLAEQVPFSAEPLQENLHIMCSDDFSSHSSVHLELERRPHVRGGNDEESLLALLMEDNGGTDDSHRTENAGENFASNPVQQWVFSPQRLNKEVTYSPPLPTGRISFKLYDWNPGDFPRQLRQQVMDWLSNMPVDLEGYIRSGCTILTIFISMPEPTWDELSADWAGSVLKLVEAEQGLFKFWSSGYLIARMDDHVVHIENGELIQSDSESSRTVSDRVPVLDRVRPLCLEVGCEEEVTILGRNFKQPHSRLLVSFDGKYIINESCQHHTQGAKQSAICWVDEADNGEDARMLVSMPSLLSKNCGTAYIEIEHLGGTSNYIPLLVAEKEIIEEVRSLEKEIDRPTTCCSSNVGSSPGFGDLGEKGVHNLLLDLGWVLKNTSLINSGPDFQVEILELHLERLRRVLFFGVKRSWCRVVGRILQLANMAGLAEKIGVLENGISALQVAVLHHQFAMVQHLITCTESLCSHGKHKLWWDLDFPGPNGWTALHMLALQPGAQGLLDTLLKRKGTEYMWKGIQHKSGWTPMEYAVHGNNISCRIDINGSLSLSHIEHSSKAVDQTLISLDLSKFECGYILSSRFCGDTRSLIGSLPYAENASAWKQKFRVMRGWFSVPFGRYGYEGLNMYISKGRKRNFQLLSTVSVLLVCVGLCVVLQRPNQVIVLSLSLRQCLWGFENGSQ